MLLCARCYQCSDSKLPILQCTSYYCGYYTPIWEHTVSSTWGFVIVLPGACVNLTWQALSCHSHFCKVACAALRTWCCNFSHGVQVMPIHPSNSVALFYHQTWPCFAHSVSIDTSLGFYTRRSCKDKENLTIAERIKCFIRNVELNHVSPNQGVQWHSTLLSGIHM